MKRLLAVLIFSSLFFQIFAPLSLAQTATPSAQPIIPPGRVNSDVPNDYGMHTQMVVIEVMAAITCQIAGIDPVNPNGKCLGVDPNTGKIGFVENGGGAIGVAKNMIAGTFNLPVSSTQYVRYLASDFGISKNTYAQEENTGEGFEKIEPLMSVWIPFRNLVYILFVIAFMLIGFGIVFRFKIDPKTVMTIQNSIPKIIITLVLVTFSFAISGFMIDIMYLFIYILFELFASVQGVRLGDLSPGNIQASTPFGALGAYGGIHGLSFHAASSVGDIINPIVKNLIDSIVPGGGGGGFFGTISRGVSGAVGWAMGPILGGIATGITLLIFFIATLSALFRLWFVLLKSYLFIIIDIIIAPVWIVGSLIPGSPLTAGSWFRHILKYISVFPVTFFMFLLGAVLVQIFNVNGNTTFTPPLIGSSVDPQHLGALLGLALLLMTPEVINMIQSVIKAPENKFQASIGKAVGVGTAVSSTPVKKTREALFKKDADGTPIGPGAIAAKYLKLGAQSKAKTAISTVGKPLTGSVGAVQSKLPEGFRRRVRPLGWLREKQIENADRYRERTGKQLEGAIERQRQEDARVARNLTNTNNQALIQQAGNNINIDVNVPLTSEESQNITDEQIEPIFQRMKASGLRNHQSDDEIRNDARQELLHGQIQQITDIQQKINTQQPLTDADRALFVGLAQNIAEDRRFQELYARERTNPANARMTNDEVRRIALDHYHNLFPILSRRYALKNIAENQS